MWINLFPNVSIVKYVAVAGKCQICAELYAMQEQCKSSDDYENIKFVMNCHRSAVTRTRLAYYERRILAQEHPEMYMSIIPITVPITIPITVPVTRRTSRLT
jgi:hypothetical protein